MFKMILRVLGLVCFPRFSSVPRFLRSTDLGVFWAALFLLKRPDVFTSTPPGRSGCWAKKQRVSKGCFDQGGNSMKSPHGRFLGVFPHCWVFLVFFSLT